MQTQLFHMDQMEEAAALIRAGHCVAFQTETVYGLGADASQEDAVKKIYEAKGRPSDNPLIVHVSSVDQARELSAAWPKTAEQLVQAFWPGPITLILPVKEGVLADVVTAGLDTVGLRFPATEAAQKLIQLAGCPIAAPSANSSGKPSPTTADHVYHDLQGKIAGIVDTGPATVGVESTIIDLTAKAMPVILRPGGLSREDIQAVIGPVAVSTSQVADDQTPIAPGMKYKHYSPDELVYIVDAPIDEWGHWMSHFQERGEKVGVLADQAVLNRWGKEAVAQFSLGDEGDEISASSRLFEGLRFFAETPATVILAQAYDLKGLGAAYMNRLEKAAGQKYLR